MLKIEVEIVNKHRKMLSIIRVALKRALHNREAQRVVATAVIVVSVFGLGYSGVVAINT